MASPEYAKNWENSCAVCQQNDKPPEILIFDPAATDGNGIVTSFDSVGTMCALLLTALNVVCDIGDAKEKE